LINIRPVGFRKAVDKKCPLLAPEKHDYPVPAGFPFAGAGLDINANDRENQELYPSANFALPRLRVDLIKLISTSPKKSEPLAGPAFIHIAVLTVDVSQIIPPVKL
jgi:hypothetical protein